MQRPSVAAAAPPQRGAGASAVAAAAGGAAATPPAFRASGAAASLVGSTLAMISSPSAPPRIRVASGAHPGELRCQQPDCSAPLDVSAVPVEHESASRAGRRAVRSAALHALCIMGVGVGGEVSSAVVD
jgi:hypothetical protein